jgi:hypothetical protein
MKEEYIKPFVTLIAVVLIGSLVWVSNKEDSTEVLKSSASETSFISDDEVKDQLDSTLDVLMRIHNVSVTDKEITSPESIIIDELTESMNDLNKLKGLTYKTEQLLKSKNEVISGTGLVLDVSVKSLIKVYDSWIQYLRSVDINNIDVSEFQYQLALFQSSTHDVYLTLVEHASLLPMVTVIFAQNENEENTVNEDLKIHFLTKIDELFSDIFADDDQFYRETKNRYAIAILVRGYKEFYER